MRAAHPPEGDDREARSSVRALADQAFSRAAGAPLIAGNSVRLLKDAGENYPAWLDAIRRAERTVHFENYFLRSDATGDEFAAALVAKAQAGVHVRLLYDWLGGFGKTRRKFWKRLRAGGVEVRCYNPPRLDSPLGWISRDHRKMLAVDGRVGFVTGLCVGREWVGYPERGIPPWRDTGVEVRGPAVADIERAFEQVWGMAGGRIPEGELVSGEELSPAGDTAVRVLATVPSTAGLYRVDQLVAAFARERLWLTDAYYSGTAPYVQALRAAAGEGVDVRLLVTLREGGADVVVTSLAQVQVAVEPPSTWALVYEDFDPARQGIRESLCALGNGYFTTRGAAAWARADDVHYPGTYLAGGYNRLRTDLAGRVVENEDLVNFPNWLALEFRLADGDWFKERTVRMLSYRQELDLRRGMLLRTMRFEDGRGRRSTLTERRLVSMSEMHLSALELALTAENWSASVTLCSAIDGRVLNGGVKIYRKLSNNHLEPLAGEAVGEDGVSLLVRTCQSNRVVAQ